MFCHRLQDPSSCPFNGQRNDSCNCMKDANTIAGRTMFKKVRINVKLLTIIRKDNFYIEILNSNVLIL